MEINTRIRDEFNIIGEVNFLEAITALQAGTCDTIFGKSGGLLVLDKNKAVVYRAYPEKGLYFSVEAYLNPWRLLKKK